MDLDTVHRQFDSHAMVMTEREYQALWGWLDELERTLVTPTAQRADERPLDDARQRELFGIAATILKYIARVLDFRNLDQKLRAERTLNTSAMTWLTDEFERLALQDVLHVALDHRSDDGRPVIQMLREFISEVSESHKSRRDLSLSLEMWGDSLSGHLLREALVRGRNLAKIRQRAAQHIQFLSDEDMRKVAEGTQEPIQSWRRRFQDLDVPAFDAKTREGLASQIAEYIVETYPAAWARLVAEGATSLPHLPFGILRIMSWSQDGAGVEFTHEERLVLDILGRLAIEFFPWQVDIAALLGLDSEHNMIVGDSEKRQSGKLRNGIGRGREQTIASIRNLRNLLRMSTFFEKERSPLEETLRRFRLAHEVRCQDIRGDWVKRNEEWHQRNVAHFLTVHGYHVAGRKLGRNQPDFVVNGVPEVVVETKLYKQAAPTEAKFRASLVQLQSYMEDQPLLRRGILFALNFTSTMILPPREWICGGRYYIVVVNLLAAAPSRRRRSITIEHDAQETIRWTTT